MAHALESPSEVLVGGCVVFAVLIVGTFTSDTMQLCLYEQNVYTVDEPGKVQVRTHQVT